MAVLFFILIYLDLRFNPLLATSTFIDAFSSTWATRAFKHGQSTQSRKYISGMHLVYVQSSTH